MGKQFYTYVHARPSGEPFYVGKGLNGRARQFLHLRSQHHKNIVSKHGRENVIITILPMTSESDAFEVEKYLIAEYRRAGFRLCNMTTGGEGATGYVKSEASKAKMSATVKGRKKPAGYGAKMSSILRGRPSANKGRKRSQETRSKMSVSAKKRLSTPEARAKASQILIRANTGRPLSLEHKINLSNVKRGKKRTDEQRAYMSSQRRGRPAPNFTGHVHSDAAKIKISMASKAMWQKRLFLEKWEMVAHVA